MECGNRLRVGVRAKNASVSGFVVCRPFSGKSGNLVGKLWTALEIYSERSSREARKLLGISGKFWNVHSSGRSGEVSLPRSPSQQIAIYLQVSPMLCNARMPMECISPCLSVAATCLEARSQLGNLHFPSRGRTFYARGIQGIEVLSFCLLHWLLFTEQ